MEATETKIINSAIDVFNKDLSATLETVAKHAGLTRRTLNRYFKDRSDLMSACTLEMQSICKKNMNRAYNSSQEPLSRLEQMLYAAIDCGSKYEFLQKLSQSVVKDRTTDHLPNDYFLDIRQKWMGLIEELHEKSLVSRKITPGWIYTFSGGVITSIIQASQAGDIAKNDVNKFAWYSFSRGIGIHSL